MKRTLLLALVSLVLATSCGGKKGGKNADRKTRITQEQIKAVMERQSFSCGSLGSASCPTGMTRLLILNKEDAESSSVCSGFMIDSNTMVTNEHCISSQAVCDDTYVAIYTGYGYEQTKCQSVKKILTDGYESNDPRKRFDVAIVKLADRYYGQTFKVSSSKTMANDSIDAWVVDHTGLDDIYEPNLFDSRITQFKCTVSSQTERQSVILDNCPIIHGNSGSPVLNSAGEVVGVIWGGTAGDMDTSTSLYTRRNSTTLQAAITESIHFIDYL